MIKFYCRKIFIFILRCIIRLSVFRFKTLYNFKNLDVSCPTVNTYGDPFHHYDYIRLKYINKKKKFLIISPKIEPSKTLLPIIFQSKNYLFYDELIFRIIGNFLKLEIFKKTDMYYYFNHFLLEEIILKVSNFKFYEDYYEKKDPFLVNENLKTKFVKSYISMRKENNKIDNLNQLYKLREKYGYYKISQSPKFKKNKIIHLKNKLNINGKYIIIHIRNHLYDNYGDVRRDIRSIDNLQSYEGLISYLQKEYKIVLIGNKKDKFYQRFNNKNLINYSASSYQSVENDFYLISNCEFFIGNFSGPSAIAVGLNKPVMIFDCQPLFVLWDYNKVRYFPKYVYKKNKLISIYEIIKNEAFFKEEFFLKKVHIWMGRKSNEE